MENELVIRKAGTDDINTIGFLARCIWPETYKGILSGGQINYMMELFYSPDSLRKQFTYDVFLLAELDNEPVGFASYSEKEPGIFKLHKIYVQPGIQGKGLGRALVDHVFEDINASHAQSLTLNVNRFNKARNFYEKLGFNVIGEEDIDIGNGYQMNDYVMQRLCSH